MATIRYPQYAANAVCQARFDWLTGDFWVLLLRSSATYDEDDVYVSDVIAGGQEIVRVGYERLPLEGRLIDVVAGVVRLLGDDVSWDGIAASDQIGAAIVYQKEATDAESPVVFWYDGGSAPNELPFTTDGGPFAVEWPDGVVATA